MMSCLVAPTHSKAFLLELPNARTEDSMLTIQGVFLEEQRFEESVVCRG